MLAVPSPERRRRTAPGTANVVLVGLVGRIGAAFAVAFAVNWVATAALLRHREFRGTEDFGAANNATWRAAWPRA